LLKLAKWNVDLAKWREEFEALPEADGAWHAKSHQYAFATPDTFSYTDYIFLDF